MSKIMKFSANLSTLFSDLPTLIDRYKAVVLGKHKFDIIECQNPYEHQIQEWQEAFDYCQQRIGPDQQLPKWDLINSCPHPDSMRTCPNWDVYQDTVFKRTFSYAQFLKVSKIHWLMFSRDEQPDAKHQDNLEDEYKNLGPNARLLKHVAKQLQNTNITCLVEPLSTRPDYYLQSYYDAIDLVKQVNESNLKVMVDSYHMQRLNGNITRLLESLGPMIGHVQVSQVPARDSPAHAGEIDFDYFFRQIAKQQINLVGLEYSDTCKGDFDWTRKYESL